MKLSVSFRYWSITNIYYVQNRTPKRIFLMLLIIWILSLLISLAPIFGWKDAQFVSRVQEQHVCLISQQISYQVRKLKFRSNFKMQFFRYSQQPQRFTFHFVLLSSFIIRSWERQNSGLSENVTERRWTGILMTKRESPKLCNIQMSKWE